MEFCVQRGIILILSAAARCETKATLTLSAAVSARKTINQRNGKELESLQTRKVLLTRGRRKSQALVRAVAQFLQYVTAE